MPLPSGSPRILVVDDDQTVAAVVVDYLEAAGYAVDACPDGQAAWERARHTDYRAIVLDIMLPGLDGLEVLRRLRAGGVTTPVVLLSAKGSEAERIVGFEGGADDYVTKPFSPRELVLRIQAVLRRAQPAERGDDTLRDGALTVDQRARTVTVAGEPVALALREFDLLAYFLSHPGEVLSRSRLMREVWGWASGDPATVTVHVRRLREKIEADPAHPVHLVTVWGRGYRWDSAKEER